MDTERDETAAAKAHDQRLARAALNHRDGREMKNPMYKGVVAKRPPLNGMPSAAVATQ
jgi:hypothetical protein